MTEDVLQTARRLAETIEAKDPYTRGHAHAVSVTAVALGQEVGITGDRLNLVEAAGLLHDVGYVDVDPTILTKPSQLTTDEFRHIQLHPEVGARMVEAIPSLSEAANFIRLHHERCDGQGYPFGLKREEIPIEARIIAVAETYDALTAHRAHRAAFSPVQVVRGLRTAARAQLDNGLVDSLLSLLKRLAGGCNLESLGRLPSLDQVVGVEQQLLRDTFVGVSVNLTRLFDYLLGDPTRRMLEQDVTDMLHRGGIRLTLKEMEIEDRLPSRASPADLASEYRAALAQQIAQIEQVVGSRLTRYYLGVILDHLGSEATRVCRQYRLCETPLRARTPFRVSDSPVIVFN